MAKSIVDVAFDIDVAFRAAPATVNVDVGAVVPMQMLGTTGRSVEFIWGNISA